MGTLYLGTQGFSYKSWVGPFYPQGTRPADYLPEYAEHFRALELDSTFYGPPRASSVRSWYEKTPPDFTFTAKFPKTITHDKKLLNAEEETGVFLDVMSDLREKCGPLVLQFMYDFTPQAAPVLDKYLSALPKSFRYAVEFRNRAWMSAEYWSLLEKHNVGLCLHDLYYMPKTVHATTDFTYVRFLGKRGSITKFDRLQIDRNREQAWWGGVVKDYLAKGLDVYAFFNDVWAGFAPGSARQFLELVAT